MDRKYVKWLLELTNLPTASGREERVEAWIERYVARKPSLKLERDKFGNITIRRAGGNSSSPIYITAHMDHPAFVVHQVEGARTLIAEFRGGVDRDYFEGSPVLLFHGRSKAQRGVIRAFVSRGEGTGMGVDDGAKLLRVEFARNVKAAPGDVLRWDVGESRIKGDILRAPGCDDTAGVAAAVAAFDAIGTSSKSDVRLLFTRAEEVGFIGAIAACKAKSIPRKARLICLENSKSFAESPIGAGPIVRVGDFTSTFDPDLTYRISQIAGGIAQRESDFKFQRKLMPGGTCEASAFQSYGYVATCLCLPLGNYHNMNLATRKPDAEFISVRDYLGLVRLLTEVGRKLDDPAQSPPLRKRLDTLFAQRRGVLDR